MPCYLFTWHTYGSWLPDRQQGYVHWNRGLCGINVALAECYKMQQKEPIASLTPELQKLLIIEALQAAHFQKFTLHAVACEDSHIHLLISWKGLRPPKALRRSVRHSLSLKLNDINQRHWFSRGGDLRRVMNRKHFNHLYHVYLPSHRGMKWNRERGIYH